MKAELKRLHSPDVHDLEAFAPEIEDNFSFLLQAMVGPEGLDGEESFDIQVCTPKWLMDHHDRSDVVPGIHYLIVFGYDYACLLDAIAGFCSQCSGGNWQDITAQLGRLGKWEFENYQEAPRL